MFVLKYYLAIDIGASSGRHIVGWKEAGITLRPFGRKDRVGCMPGNVANDFNPFLQRKEQSGCFGLLFSHPALVRYSPGVIPVAFLKTLWKWLWEE